MNKEQLHALTGDIEVISKYFEEKPFTDSVKMLKENFDTESVQSPGHYLQVMDQVSELLRQTRFLFICSVLNKVCLEENKWYSFSEPFQAKMAYSAVMKRDGFFYVLDEDGDHNEIFTSENFMQFIDDQYWELYE
ncbi:hypothetical protein [Flavobacterium notoginsengisoli]|uniref:hypothetical protein n=1 Tax=Flavobacterium notoginsengisoli TaxID=1478199 RepID=UPI003643D3E3